jgi:DUF1680 family protein
VKRAQPNVIDSPYRKLKPTAPGSVRWTSGFWGKKFALCQETILPSMRQAMDVPENGAVFENLYIAAGLAEGEHLGTHWSDGDCYKWMEAVAHVYGVTGDPALDQALDELVDVIAQAQDPDGYICTQVQLTEVERWQATHHHELYNMGHLMTAAYVHHRVTGKEGFLSVACKLADYLYTVFQPRPPELANFAWNPSNIMGLVDLYRATGEKKYAELAGVFVDIRGSSPRGGGWAREHVGSDGSDQNQDRVPLRKETGAVGHAVTATYLYCGATDVYAETGERALLAALERIWGDVVSRRMYVTGAVGAHHHAVSKRGDVVWEAFGLDYQLPNAIAYNETCANIGNGMWNWRLLGITAEAKYADVMEQVIYNSGLSPVSVDGRHFCYTNPLRWHGSGHLRLSHDTPSRWMTHDCYCCPPQVARTIARMQDWAYGLSEEGVWVHLYGSNRLESNLLDGSSLVLTQETDYPWDGQITITIQEAPETPFAVMLRVPSWARGATIAVNGKAADVEAKPGTYAALERTWSAGDEIALTLPMPARLVVAHPRVEEARNQVAVMCGPVVYCLESIDLPSGIDIARSTCPRALT